MSASESTVDNPSGTPSGYRQYKRLRKRSKSAAVVTTTTNDDSGDDLHFNDASIGSSMEELLKINDLNAEKFGEADPNQAEYVSHRRKQKPIEEQTVINYSYKDSQTTLLNKHKEKVISDKEKRAAEEAAARKLKLDQEETEKAQRRATRLAQEAEARKFRFEQEEAARVQRAERLAKEAAARMLRAEQEKTAKALRRADQYDRTLERLENEKRSVHQRKRQFLEEAGVEIVDDDMDVYSSECDGGYSSTASNTRRIRVIPRTPLVTSTPPPSFSAVDASTEQPCSSTTTTTTLPPPHPTTTSALAPDRSTSSSLLPTTDDEGAHQEETNDEGDAGDGGGDDAGGDDGGGGGDSSSSESSSGSSSGSGTDREPRNNDDDEIDPYWFAEHWDDEFKLIKQDITQIINDHLDRIPSTKHNQKYTVETVRKFLKLVKRLSMSWSLPQEIRREEFMPKYEALIGRCVTAHFGQHDNVQSFVDEMVEQFHQLTTKTYVDLRPSTLTIMKRQFGIREDDPTNYNPGDIYDKYNKVRADLTGLHSYVEVELIGFHSDKFRVFAQYLDEAQTSIEQCLLLSQTTYQALASYYNHGHVSESYSTVGGMVGHDLSLVRVMPLEVLDLASRSYHRCCEFASAQVYLQGLRKLEDDEMLYRPMYTKDTKDEQNRRYTFTYVKYMTLKKFCSQIFSPKVNPERYCDYMSSHNNIKNIISYFMDREHDQMPALKKLSYCFAFNDGVFNADTLKFTYYTNKKGVTLNADNPNAVCANYFPMNFQRGLEKELGKFFINKKKNYADIPTPVHDMIFETQGWDEEVQLWFWILYGRIFFPVGYDNWQIFMWFIGWAATGKSTLLQSISRVFSSEDVAAMSNNTEVQFGLQSKYDKFLIVCPDVKAKFNLEAGTFQSMASGEIMEVPRKFKNPKFVEWVVQMLFASNIVPHWDDQSSSIARRLAVFRFTKIPKNYDPRLSRKLEKERPFAIRKAAEAYQMMRRRIRIKGVGTALSFMPDYFDDTRKRFQASTNSLVDFLTSGALRFGPPLQVYMTEVAFVEAYRKFCKVRRLDQQPWNPDSYDKPLTDRKCMVSKPNDIPRQITINNQEFKFPSWKQLPYPRPDRIEHNLQGHDGGYRGTLVYGCDFSNTSIPKAQQQKENEERSRQEKIDDAEEKRQELIDAAEEVRMEKLMKENVEIQKRYKEHVRMKRATKDNRKSHQDEKSEMTQASEAAADATTTNDEGDDEHDDDDENEDDDDNKSVVDDDLWDDDSEADELDYDENLDDAEGVWCSYDDVVVEEEEEEDMIDGVAVSAAIAAGQKTIRRQGSTLLPADIQAIVKAAAESVIRRRKGEQRLVPSLPSFVDDDEGEKGKSRKSKNNEKSKKKRKRHHSHHHRSKKHRDTEEEEEEAGVDTIGFGGESEQESNDVENSSDRAFINNNIEEEEEEDEEEEEEEEEENDEEEEDTSRKEQKKPSDQENELLNTNTQTSDDTVDIAVPSCINTATVVSVAERNAALRALARAQTDEIKKANEKRKKSMKNKKAIVCSSDSESSQRTYKPLTFSGNQVHVLPYENVKKQPED